MAIITFTSDFGNADHYVAAVKAKILSINPNLNIIDISHKINPCDIGHASFVLKSAFREFPEGTIHIIAVDTLGADEHKFLAIQLEGHYFIGSDNGIFGLISEKVSQKIIDINSLNPLKTNFPAKDIFAPVAAKIASGIKLSDLGKMLKEYKAMIPRRVRATKKQISGHVIRVDHYGNLITNIEESEFNFLSKNKKFSISYGRDRSYQINESYSSVENGECFVIFNSLGLMEIGINKGNASQLLGLNHDSSIIINFEE